MIKPIETIDDTVIAQLYADVFAGAPYFEDWTLDAALSEYTQCREKTGFVGVVKVQDENLVGFAWGYDMPTTDFERVPFSQYCQLAKGEPCFYAAETGIRPEYQNQGLGKELLIGRTKLVSQDIISFRTKTPAIVHIYEKYVGNIINKLSDESAYDGGMFYLVEKNKTLV
jgi:ribosomal protein S18 acetylase RimI-like enzyme